MAMLRTPSETSDYGNSLNSSNIMELAFQSILNEIIEDVIADLCFKVHRGVKLGYYPMHEYIIKDNKFEIYDPSQENGSRIYHTKGSEIFGRYKRTQTFLCCPRCQKKLCSSRFAPHLYNCMGFGRRLCGKRSTTKRPTLDMYESDHDDDDSSDCNGSSRKRKKGKNTKKKSKGKNSESFVSSSSEANYTEMTQENIRDCLSQMCGVISERTGRFCRNTLKCSMHVDDQRREVRDLLLGSPADQIADDIHIDVDTVDEDSAVPMWYSNRKTSKKNSPVENNICTSSTGVSNNRQEDYTAPLSKFASSSFS